MRIITLDIETIPDPDLMQRYAKPVEVKYGNLKDPALRRAKEEEAEAARVDGGGPGRSEREMPALATPEYLTALEKVRKASETYRAVCEAYRSGVMSTDDYLTCRRAYEKENEAFEQAWNKETHS